MYPTGGDSTVFLLVAAAVLERELGCAFYDSTSAGVWGGLHLMERRTAPGRRWGSLFGQIWRYERGSVTATLIRGARILFRSDDPT